MPAEFGNTWKEIRTLMIVCLGIGVVIAVAIGAMNHHQGRPLDIKMLLGFSLGIGGLIPLFVLPTLLVSIRIEDGVISHWFCRRWKQSEGRVEDLTKVEIAVGSGAKFYFANGKSFSFMGADLMILQAMCLHIMELRPEFNNFIFGSRAAMILKAVQLFQAKRGDSGASSQ
ncbi:hypothetical protein [Prosthecobacter sp.]|uniref:hypothetical protein n=1 Tax=Prosthecobacter sp. TaxID=1965333 RepID=UPI0037842E97